MLCQGLVDRHPFPKRKRPRIITTLAVGPMLESRHKLFIKPSVEISSSAQSSSSIRHNRLWQPTSSCPCACSLQYWRYSLRKAEKRRTQHCRAMLQIIIVCATSYIQFHTLNGLIVCYSILSYVSYREPYSTSSLHKY